MTTKTYPLRRAPEVGDYFRNTPDGPIMRRLANNGALWRALDTGTLDLIGPSDRVVDCPFICNAAGELLQTGRPFAEGRHFHSAPQGYYVYHVADDDGLREIHAEIGAFLLELDAWEASR